MKRMVIPCLTTVAALALTGQVAAAGKYYAVNYPGSDRAGELKLPVSYTLWVPDGPAKFRGIVVHLHGNGPEAGKAGAVAAHDLHWQALARKWDCALLAPNCPTNKDNWFQFFVPGAGSRQNFHTALRELGEKSKHPELERVPWCLWGHSAGGIWSGLMQASDPDRIVAVWLRSGTGWGFAEQGHIPDWRLTPTEKVRQVPVVINYGVKEKENETDALGMLRAFRPTGAPVGVAPEPNNGHNCGTSRFLAIPFFDACLAMRLPDKGVSDQILKPIDMTKAWLAEPLSDKAVPAAQYKGDPKGAVWLPNERIARMWMEYVKTGNVPDPTPPPAPTNVRAAVKGKLGTEVTWDAEVDVESGVRAFLVLRDGQQVGRIGGRPGDGGGSALQGRSFHDTPTEREVPFRYVDADAKPGAKSKYQVVAVNCAGLRSDTGKSNKER